MKTGTEAKAKFKKLRRRLKLPLWQCIGILEAIWQLTATSQPDGGLGRLTNEDIAASIEYDGDENELVDVLLELGWLDHYGDDPAVRFVVHDWADHCPSYIKGNFRRYGIDFLVPAREPIDDAPKQGAKDGAKQPAKHTAKQSPKQGAKDGATYPILSNPIQSNPPPPTPSAPEAAHPIDGQGGEGAMAAPDEPSPEPPAAGAAEDDPAAPSKPDTTPPKPSPTQARADAWTRAREACDEAGAKRSGYLVDMCRQRGFPPQHLELAAIQVRDSSGAYGPGALDWWIKNHELGRTWNDKRSWPTADAKAIATKPKPPDPKQARDRVLHEATSEAKAGRVEQAIAALERAGIERNAWPAVVLHKLTAQPTGP